MATGVVYNSNPVQVQNAQIGGSSSPVPAGQWTSGLFDCCHPGCGERSSTLTHPRSHPSTKPRLTHIRHAFITPLGQALIAHSPTVQSLVGVLTCAYPVRCVSPYTSGATKEPRIVPPSSVCGVQAPVASRVAAPPACLVKLAR